MSTRFSFLLLFMIITFVLNEVWATADGPDCYRVLNVKKNDSLNIRSKPNASAKILGKIPHNADGIKNLGCAEMPQALRDMYFSGNYDAKEIKDWRKNHHWCHIQFQNVKGFVHSNFVGEGSCP